MKDLIERLRLGEGTSPDHALLIEAANALEKASRQLDSLGMAISDAGYTWTPKMREAYEAEDFDSYDSYPERLFDENGFPYKSHLVRTK